MQNEEVGEEKVEVKYSPEDYNRITQERYNKLKELFFNFIINDINKHIELGYDGSEYSVIPKKVNELIIEGDIEEIWENVSQRVKSDIKKHGWYNVLVDFNYDICNRNRLYVSWELQSESEPEPKTIIDLIKEDIKRYFIFWKN